METRSESERQLRRIVYLLVALVAIFGCIAVAALVISVTKGNGNSDDGSVSKGNGNSDDGSSTSLQQKDACSSFPCRNQGTCVHIPDNYVCVCRTTYFGRNCELGGMKETIFFATYTSEETTVPDGTIMRWNDIRFDPGNNFDGSTGAYFAPADGYYQFSVSKRVKAAELSGLLFLVDGVWDTYCVSRGSAAQANCDRVLKLRAGQRVQIQNYRGSVLDTVGPNGNINSWFTGYMLYPL